MSLTGQIAEFQNYEEYREIHWDGSFEDYLEKDDLLIALERNALGEFDLVLHLGACSSTTAGSDVACAAAPAGAAAKESGQLNSSVGSRSSADPVRI